MKDNLSKFYNKKKIPIKGVVLTGKKIRMLEEEDIKLKQFKKRYNL